MEYFVISAKFVPLKYYTLSSQLRRLTSFSVGLFGSANSVTRSYPVMQKSCIAGFILTIMQAFISLFFHRSITCALLFLWSWAPIWWIDIKTLPQEQSLSRKVQLEEHEHLAAEWWHWVWTEGKRHSSPLSIGKRKKSWKKFNFKSMSILQLSGGLESEQKGCSSPLSIKKKKKKKKTASNLAWIQLVWDAKILVLVCHD